MSRLRALFVSAILLAAGIGRAQTTGEIEGRLTDSDGGPLPGVSVSAPPIDPASTTTGTTYTSRVITHLPVGRNYADIVRSNPGVVDGSRRHAGALARADDLRRDLGREPVDHRRRQHDQRDQGIQGKAINNEFIQEVEVKTGGYQAEYGRALGGIVNVITKSGGNEFHGDGFVYYDSTGTAAESELKPGDSEIASMRVVDGHRVDYGVDLGGFLLKDRLWFFGAYNRVDLPAELSRVGRQVRPSCRAERRARTGFRSTRRSISTPES